MSYRSCINIFHYWSWNNVVLCALKWHPHSILCLSLSHFYIHLNQVRTVHTVRTSHNISTYIYTYGKTKMMDRKTTSATLIFVYGTLRHGAVFMCSMYITFHYKTNFYFSYLYLPRTYMNKQTQRCQFRNKIWKRVFFYWSIKFHNYDQFYW